jgi:hypothetical protein
LTYVLPEDEDFLIVARPSESEDGDWEILANSANIIGIPEGYAGEAKLSIAPGNIMLIDLKKNTTTSVQLFRPFLLNDSVICTLRPMPPSLTS